MQFIYLGEATLYEERMNEFVSVAKSLEIKEICTAETKTETNDDDEPSPSNPEASTYNSGEQTLRSNHLMNQAPRSKIRVRKDVVRVKGKYECDQCDKTYTSILGLQYHKQSAHEGVRYACDKCDHQATQQCDLRRHIESKHEGIKYACDQCDYQATQQSHLKIHLHVWTQCVF